MRHTGRTYLVVNMGRKKHISKKSLPWSPQKSTHLHFEDESEGSPFDHETSRFRLNTVKWSSSVLYRKHGKQPVCEINFCAVLPAVLRYCAGSCQRTRSGDL